MHIPSVDELTALDIIYITKNILRKKLKKARDLPY